MLSKSTTHDSNGKNSRVGIDTGLGPQGQNLLFSIDLLGLVIDLENDLAFLFLRHALGTSHLELVLGFWLSEGSFGGGGDFLSGAARKKCSCEGLSFYCLAEFSSFNNNEDIENVRKKIRGERERESGSRQSGREGAATKDENRMML